MIDRTVTVSVGFFVCLVDLMCGVIVRCILEPSILMRMMGVTQMLACLLRDATGVSYRVAEAITVVVVQMSDKVHTGNQLAVTQRHDQQGMNEFSAFHCVSIVAADISCQIYNRDE